MTQNETAALSTPPPAPPHRQASPDRNGSSPNGLHDVYGARTVKRYRRTGAEIAALRDELAGIAAAEQPLSVRALFYRAESAGLVSKDKSGERTVQRLALAMRRDGQIPYEWITDGTRWQIKPESWSGPEAALRACASAYRRTLWLDQPVYVEVWSEKDAISGTIAQVTEDFDVPMMVARGFSSETFLHTAAQVMRRIGKPTVILQVGEHDPSGWSAWRTVQRELPRFAPDIEFEFRRVAVTPAQVEEFGLQTRQSTPTDPRRKAFFAAYGDGAPSIEVDAMPSSELRRLMREAIESHIDPKQLRIARIAERIKREVLHRIARGWNGGAP